MLIIITQIQHPLRKKADKKQNSGTGSKKARKRKSTKEEFFKLPRDFFK